MTKRSGDEAPGLHPPHSSIIRTKNLVNLVPLFCLVIAVYLKWCNQFAILVLVSLYIKLLDGYAVLPIPPMLPYRCYHTYFSCQFRTFGFG